MDRGWGLQIPGQSISSEQWLSGQTQLPSQLSGNFIKKSQFTGNLKKVMIASAFLVNAIKAVSPTPDFRYYQWYLVTETAFSLLMSRYVGRWMTLWWRAFRDTEVFTKMQMKICFWEKTDNPFNKRSLEHLMAIGRMQLNNALSLSPCRNTSSNGSKTILFYPKR